MNTPHPLAGSITLPPRQWVRRVVGTAPTPKIPGDARTLAFHEAGHAVVAAGFGVPLDRIEVNFQRLRGAVHVDRPACRQFAEERGGGDEARSQSLEEFAAVSAATIYMAGKQAELLLHEIAVEGTLRPSDTDTIQARRVLLEAFGHDAPLWYCQRLARYLLACNWGLVTSVAEELLASGTIQITDFTETA